MPDPGDWIEHLAEQTADPARVRFAMGGLAQVWPAEFPPLLEIAGRFEPDARPLGDLLAASVISAEKLVRDPEALVWLSQPEMHASGRDARRIVAEIEKRRGEATAFDPNFKALRLTKNREMLRIALREVAGMATLEQSTLELSILAEVCVRQVCDGWLAELSRRWGTPQTDFAVLGMGKLGGEELNYSSDIDVIFLYGEEGRIRPQFDHHEFFTRLAERIVETFSSPDPAGSLFRIDLRLRPEGASGPLVRALESVENYYAGFGETWERMALIKARGVGGSEELAYEFAQRLQPFVFPRALSPDLLDEIAAIKRRIERDIVGVEHLHRNVKLGYGGIREIEFIVQALQLLHGARNAFLQNRNTLATLRALQELQILPAGEMATLSDAYRFLRTVEHRLQIEGEAQTHTLPENADELARIARSLKFPDAESFRKELDSRTGAVRSIFDKMLRGAAEEESAQVDTRFFKNPEQAAKNLHVLAQGTATGHVAPRTKNLFRKLEPLLLEWLARIADPDLALARFVRFVERYGIRGLLFETLVTHPKLLELLVRLFDGSRFLTDIVLRRPQLVEEITRAGFFDKTHSVADYLAGLGQSEEGLPWHEWERVYRRGQIFRIFLRDILRFASIEEVQAEYSALAEACLAFTQRNLGLDGLTVVALGKFGGRELSYGCDLDVVFAGDPADAGELIRAMTATTAEGIVFPVDARLRPEGASGLLAVPVESYRKYFESRAQMWEAQALTKARPVSGPLQAEFLDVAQEAWRRFGARPDLIVEIKAMHERVVQNRAGAEDALRFKTGTGGLMELEFMIQALQMRHRVWEPNTIRALGALCGAGIFPEDQCGLLRESYLFLRRIESVVRRVENSSISVLPREEGELGKVAKRCGFGSPEEFTVRHQEARRVIHEAFEAQMR